MKLEHFALNVAEPVEMTKWYEEHLGLKVVRQMNEAPFTTFLADDSGTIMLEIYYNSAAEVLNFKSMDPLLVHLAFVSEDPEKDSERLMAVGATMDKDLRLPDGSHLVMLRDPWGLALQLCKRAVPMI